MNPITMPLNPRRLFRHQLFGILALILLWGVSCLDARSQDYQAREHYGQLLEPVEGILHGVGQDGGQHAGPGQDAFQLYWNTMPNDARPLVYMYYESLFNIGTDWADSLKVRLEPFEDRMIVLQFGLQLVGATEAVANGSLDSHIDDWLDGIERLGLPVYARLGYEFNGRDWNGYEPGPYRAAFVYLTDKIRERDLEIATVWNYVPEPSQPTDFMSYYPGDSYVDWWSINFFNRSQIGSGLAEAYLDSAKVHQRPVLIGESTPKDIGVSGGQASWDGWFAPFFEMLAAQTGIKVSGYINWNWADFPEWATWGDARVQQNLVVRRNMQRQMGKDIFVHSVSETDFRQRLGYADAEAPSAVTGLSVAPGKFPLQLSWEATPDASGIGRYLVYVDGGLVDYTKRTNLITDKATPGATITIQVAAIDRAGNVSDLSTAVTLIVPTAENPDNVLANGNFQDGTTGWSLTTAAGALASLELDTTAVFTGSDAALIRVDQSTGNRADIALRHSLALDAQMGYTLTFRARADVPTSINTNVKQFRIPFNEYVSQDHALSTELQTYSMTFLGAQRDAVFLAFQFGASSPAAIWIDDVEVTVEDLRPAPAEQISNGEFDEGFDGWELAFFDAGADGLLEIDSTGVMSGDHSAHVTITQNTGTNFHIQLQQPMQIREGHSYQVTYQVRGSADAPIEMWLQQATAPFTGYAQRNINLTTETQEFTENFFSSVDENVFMRFMMGTAGLAEVWVDAVSVIDLTNLAADTDPEMDLPQLFTLHQAYPNPFHGTATIEYELQSAGRLKLEVYDVIGRRIALLADGIEPPGPGTVRWSPEGISSGAYFVRMTYNDSAVVRPLILNR